MHLSHPSSIWKEEKWVEPLVANINFSNPPTPVGAKGPIISGGTAGTNQPGLRYEQTGHGIYMCPHVFQDSVRLLIGSGWLCIGRLQTGEGHGAPSDKFWHESKGQNWRSWFVASKCLSSPWPEESYSIQMITKCSILRSSPFKNMQKQKTPET